MQINENDPVVANFALIQQRKEKEEEFCVMVVKEAARPTTTRMDPSPFPLNWAQEQTGSILNLQKAILESYEEASQAWMARLQSEVSLWSDLANKLSGTRSVPEMLDAYTKCISQRMKMAADDGNRLVDEAQQITQKVAQSINNGRSTKNK